MKTETEKISSSQLMFLIIGLLIGSSLLIAFMDGIAKQDAWLVIVAAFLASIPFVLSYVFLTKRFPGKSLIEINDIIFGPYLGKIVSILYVGYFLYLFLLNLRVLANFYVGFILTETPMLIILIVFTAICAYAVKKGIETIARISLVAVVCSAITVIIVFILLLGSMDFANFQPVGSTPLKSFIKGTHIFAAVSFCEIFVFLMIFPSLNKTKKTGKSTMLGFSLGALVLLIISMRNTAVLGPATVMFTNATYEASRLINIGEILTRIELFSAFGITVTLFIKACIFYYATVKSTAQLFRMRSGSPLILPIGIIGVIYALVVFESIISQQQSAETYHAMVALPFEFVIPPVSLFIAKIRKLPKQMPERCDDGQEAWRTE
ncbi:MAG: GerAB/ArcD/ProY family transporter [Bacillota bacterium]